MDALTQLPYEQGDPTTVARRMRELQERGPVHPVKTVVGDSAWIVVHHEQVRDLLDDERLGRAHRQPEVAARADASMMMGGPPPGLDFENEHEIHAQFRALLQPLFAPKHMGSLRPRVQQLTTQLLDDLERQGAPADLHSAVAVPLPLLVICELLGVPYEDRDKFRVWIKDVSSTTDRVRSEAGMLEMFDYGAKLVAEKRRNPDDDVISRLAGNAELTDEQVVMVSMSLLFAGHESTIVQIGMAVLLLLANRDQWQRLVDDPSLVPNAVEETLRASFRGGGAIPRYARTDIEVGTQKIAAGDLMLLDVGAANHDPAVFDNADRVDVTRPSSKHITFGHGSRYCLGAPLARTELQAILTNLVTRFPTMQLAVPVEELVIQRETLGGGLVTLPVQW
ncbi:cytochrome P450 [Mycobacterium sp. SMC-4]|uniref:cytochrome P450 n=1 Tax=Mycobacterium sp. SMC-4 TaxID=2857059 RepID=UPI003D059187